MKKILLFTAALAIMASCVKENAIETSPEGSYTIHASIADATKTSYDASGVFTWKTNDVARIVVYRATGENDANHYDFKAQADGPSVDFKSNGEPDWTAWPKAGFALYPALDHGGNKDAYTVTLPASYTVSGSDFAAIGIPMIGTETAEDDWNFKTAVGVLKVQLTNVPVAARKLVVTDASSYLAGTWPLNTTAASDGLAMTAATSGTHAVTVSFPQQTAGSTIEVYVPIPVGALAVGTTFDVQQSNGTSLKKLTTTKAIPVVRNKVQPITGISVESAEDWVSLGTGKFIDTFVWNDNGFAMTPVEVEFFKNKNNASRFKMANPYAAAAVANSVTPVDADDYFFFSIVEKGRISYDWVNMGLPLTKNPEKAWAMLSGQDVAGYGNDISHVVSFHSDGTPAQLQLAPCYRTSDENKTGNPSSYDNEIGKDHNNGIIEIVFPGDDLLMPFTLTADKVTVSANQSGDGSGAAGLIDNNLSTFWHTPWSSVDDKFSPVYGQYVDITLPEYATTLALNYCTRKHDNQNGAPAMVVVGGSTDGVTFTVIDTFELDYMTENLTSNTWIGLPAVDATGYGVIRFGIAKNKGGYDLRDITSTDQWCNLSELMVFGVSTGVPVEIEALPAWLEPGQVWVKESMITAANSCSHDGGGVPALVDGNSANFWHSDWYYAVTTNDPVYGIFFDIALKEALQKFHFVFQIRSENANAAPTQVVYGVSNDGVNWTKLSTEDNTGVEKGVTPGGTLITLSNLDAGAAYKYIRFGITDSTNTDPGSLTGDLNFVGIKKCVNMAELKLFAD